jgi:hypothetical protein
MLSRAERIAFRWRSVYADLQARSRTWHPWTECGTLGGSPRRAATLRLAQVGQHVKLTSDATGLGGSTGSRCQHCRRVLTSRWTSMTYESAEEPYARRLVTARATEEVLYAFG